MEINGLVCHDTLVKNSKQKLAFDEGRNYNTWRKEVKKKLTELLGIEVIANNSCQKELNIVSKEEKDGYKQIRFEFENEYGSVVPCYLLIPNLDKQKYPVVITLQGHNEYGFHASVGDALCHETLSYDTGRGTFAIQAVRQGYAALAIEQRGMGERRAFNKFGRRISLNPASENCYFEAMTALSLGRTLIGERVYDISSAIDMLSYFPECDTEKIAITGNSGGGTASYYAAAMDERIKVCVPSCGFCSYGESILKYYHCSCNYIPSAFAYFDMQDLACLIAPRRLAIIAGVYDTAFKIGGVKDGCKTIDKIYRAAGADGNARLIVTPKGHFWCEDIVWETVKEEFDKL